MKHSIKLIAAFTIIAIVFAAGCKKDDPEPPPTPIYGTFTDPRDGQDYTTIEYGSQTWFAKNLNYDLEGSWCYVDDPGNADVYGRLYTWESAMEVCPEGWHLPDKDEWSALLDYYLDGMNVAGGKLKEADTLHWKSPNTGATNESKFLALPGGYRSYCFAFLGLGEIATFWSTQEQDSITAYKYDLTYDAGSVHTCYTFKSSALSIRCVKD